MVCFSSTKPSEWFEHQELSTAERHKLRKGRMRRISVWLADVQNPNPCPQCPGTMPLPFGGTHQCRAIAGKLDTLFQGYLLPNYPLEKE